MRLLLLAARNADPAEIVRFRSVATLAQPPVDVVSLATPHADLPPSLVTTVFGLVGTSGMLPRGYTEIVGSVSRGGSRALHEFIDMLSHRLAAHFVTAGTKYRQHRAAELAALEPGSPPDAIASVLLALTGYGLGGMVDRLASGPEPLAHYAGFFSVRPRSADRLEALVSDWCGRQVQVVQFAGAWLTLPTDEQTRLRQGIFAGQFVQLGRDATIGSRVWSVQARIVLRIGPLDLAAFNALLPNEIALKQLVSLVRSYLGIETGFAINPILAAHSIPKMQLCSARLGWNTWLPSHAERHADGVEAQFEAETVEALHEKAITNDRPNI